MGVQISLQFLLLLLLQIYSEVELVDCVVSLCLMDRCEELTHWKRPWCWERSRAGGEGGNRGWDGRWHHQLNGHEFEQTLGVDDRQGRLTCCSPWGSQRVGNDWASIWTITIFNGASQVVLVVKNPNANAGDTRNAGWILGSGRSPRVGSGKHYSILAWKIQWTEQSGGLESMWHPESDMIEQLSIPQFSRSVMSDSLWPHGLQHARVSCPSPTPGAYSNSCPSSQWWHPTISSSVVPFSCLQSFSEWGSFPISQFFASGGQSIGASASVFPVNIQDWFPLGLTGLISLQSNGLSGVFSNTTVQKH